MNEVVINFLGSRTARWGAVALLGLIVMARTWGGPRHALGPGSGLAIDSTLQGDGSAGAALGVVGAVTAPAGHLFTSTGTGATFQDVNAATDGVQLTGTGSAGSPIVSAPLTTADLGLFGTGADGTTPPCGVVAVDTTLTASINCTSLTVNSGVFLNTDGYIVNVQGLLTVDGTMGRPGNNATVVAGGACAGAALVQTRQLGYGGGGGLGSSGGGGCSGGTGVTGIPDEGTTTSALSIPGGTCNTLAPTNGTSGARGQGGAGGGGTTTIIGAACSPGQVTIVNPAAGSFRSIFTAINGVSGSGRGAVTGGGDTYLGGSGGGGACAGNGTVGEGHAGCGGGGAGVVVIAARAIAGAGQITAQGGNGAGPFAGTGACPNCGGGGGGGGGTVFLIYGTGTPPTISVAGGTGATGSGSGGRGGDGGAGFFTAIKAGI